MTYDLVQERVQLLNCRRDFLSLGDVLGFEALGLGRAGTAPQPRGRALCGARLRCGAAAASWSSSRMASSRSATSSSLTSAPTCVPRIASTRSCAEVLEPLALDLIQGRWELVYRCRYLLIFGGGPGYEAHGLGRAAATSWSSLCTAPSRSAISSSATATRPSASRTAPTRSGAEVLESMLRTSAGHAFSPPTAAATSGASGTSWATRRMASRERPLLHRLFDVCSAEQSFAEELR